MFKRIVLLFLCLFTLSINYGYATEIRDIEGHWAQKDIMRLYNNNLVDGFPDGTFRPNNDIKVNEFIKIFILATNCKLVLYGEGWAGWYIESAKEYGMIKEGEFKSFDRPIKRFEVVNIISRYLDSVEGNHFENTFTDIEKSNLENTLKLFNLGIIKGYEDNTFRGNNTISRAEAAVIINRAIDAHRKQIFEKKYDINKWSKLTNLGQSSTTYYNWYEIINEKLYFYDNGKYASLNKYFPKETNISNKLILKIIKSLICEDNFVYVAYVPDKSIINQIIITFGEREEYIRNGLYSFKLIFYENKNLNLKEMVNDSRCSDKCFMELDIGKLWKELDEFKNGIYINEYNIKKIEKSLVEIFGNEESKKIVDYIKIKIPELYKNPQGEEIKDIFTVGKYTVNVYSNNYTLIMYFAK
jgi:hypothetical protein